MGGWNVGRATLAETVERSHALRAWDDDPEPGASRVSVGGATYRVPAGAAVRHRGDVVLLYLGGRVRMLTEHGELVLADDEERALRAAWSSL